MYCYHPWYWLTQGLLYRFECRSSHTLKPETDETAFSPVIGSVYGTERIERGGELVWNYRPKHFAYRFLKKNFIYNLRL